jgi:hypothetical protein
VVVRRGKIGRITIVAVSRYLLLALWLSIGTPKGMAHPVCKMKTHGVLV